MKPCPKEPPTLPHLFSNTELTASLITTSGCSGSIVHTNPCTVAACLAIQTDRQQRLQLRSSCCRPTPPTQGASLLGHFNQGLIEPAHVSYSLYTCTPLQPITVTAQGCKAGMLGFNCEQPSQAGARHKEAIAANAQLPAAQNTGNTRALAPYAALASRRPCPK